LGMLLPSADDIAQAIAKRDKIRIVPTGDHAQHRLGLTTQVPANAVYITDGAPRHIDLGKGRGIIFKHTSNMKTFGYRSDLLMLLVSAMKSIGEKNISNQQLTTLKSYLSHVNTEEFREDIKLAPAWVRKELLK